MLGKEPYMLTSRISAAILDDEDWFGIGYGSGTAIGEGGKSYETMGTTLRGHGFGDGTGYGAGCCCGGGDDCLDRGMYI